MAVCVCGVCDVWAKSCGVCGASAEMSVCCIVFVVIVFGGVCGRRGCGRSVVVVVCVYVMCDVICVCV